MQKTTFLEKSFLILAVVASASANCCGRDEKANKNPEKNSQSKFKLKLNFGENEMQPESVVKILETVGGINWKNVGTSFASAGQPVPASPNYVNVGGKPMSVADLANLLEVLNNVNWPQFGKSFAAASSPVYGYPTDHEHPIATNPNSRKINVGGKEFDVAHVAQLLEHMSKIDWKKVESSIEAAANGPGAAQQSHSSAFEQHQNELPHLAQLLEKISEIDWKKVESSVEASTTQPDSSVNSPSSSMQSTQSAPATVHGNAAKNGVNMNKQTDSFDPENHSSKLSATSQPNSDELKQTHSAPVPGKAKKPQTNVQRLIARWSIPPLVEEPHFHCKENCKHCQEDIFYGEEVTAPHVQHKIRRASGVDWKAIDSKTRRQK